MADEIASRYDTGAPATYREVATGKTYRLVNGQKVYLSPRAIDGYAESGNPYHSNILGGGGEWNTETGQFDEKSRALEYITLAGAALPFAGSAIPGLAGGGGGAPAGSGFATANSAAGLPTAGATPGLIGGPAAAASGLPKWLGPLVGAAVPAAGRLMGPGGGPSGGGSMPPEILQLLQEMIRRQQNQGPLSAAVTAQAHAGLPRTR